MRKWIQLYLRSWLSLMTLSCFAVAENSPREEPRQVSAAELRTLSAGSGEVVSVTATVCYHDPLWKFLFLTDQGNGVFASPVPGSYQPGDRLKLTGPIGNGHGVPIFDEQIVVEKVGTAELPAPDQVNLAGWDWNNGFSDARNSGWVELEGTVEQVTLIDDTARLWCHSDERSFAVTLAEKIDARTAWSYVDARIRVRGSLGILLDKKNRVHAPLLLTQKRKLDGAKSMQLFEVVEPAPEAPFPAMAAERLTYAKVDDNGSFRILGQVTLASPDKLFIDDGMEATTVRAASAFEAPVDSFVDVLGTSDKDGHWRARVFVLRNETLEIWPTLLKVSELDSRQVGRRIRVIANAATYDSEAHSLSVVDGGTKAKVILPRETGKDVIGEAEREEASLDLATANVVDFIGLLEKFEDGTPIIRVVTDDDMHVRSRRWALTPQNLLRLTALLAASLIGVGATVFLLRRQVHLRTQELSDLAAQLRASYDSVDAGVVAVGGDGKLLTVNETANSILNASLSPGDSAEAFVNRWSDIAEEASAVYEMASAFRNEHEGPSVCEVSLADGGGKIRLTLTAINREGRHVGNLWVMHDETQIQKLQSELLQAQKMEAVGTLAGGIAHDFNNLLTAILGNLELLRIMSPTEQDSNMYVEQAEAACMSAGELVQQLLGMSRKSNMRQRVVDPNEIITNIRSLLRHGFDSSIAFEFATTLDLPPVKVDATQIEQVLLNLCVNARDAMPHGGKITVATASGTLRNQPAVVINVSDTGDGIPEHIQDKIFEPFFTTKDVGKGTGLGLATSFSVVTRHQGEIRCDSSPGQGTTFSVVLPCASEDELMREELIPQIESLKGDETILIVDDEWVVRTVASNLLGSGGYRTIEAKDGVSGLEVLSDLHSEIDLVLLDVTMPGMSGHAVLGEIKSRYPALPVLMCSGYDLKGDGDGDGSFDHFVPKPFSASTLFNAIRSILDLAA